MQLLLLFALSCSWGSRRILKKRSTPKLRGRLCERFRSRFSTDTFIKLEPVSAISFNVNGPDVEYFGVYITSEDNFLCLNLYVVAQIQSAFGSLLANFFLGPAFTMLLLLSRNASEMFVPHIFFVDLQVHGVVWWSNFLSAFGFLLVSPFVSIFPQQSLHRWDLRDHRLQLFFSLLKFLLLLHLKRRGLLLVFRRYAGVTDGGRVVRIFWRLRFSFFHPRWSPWRSHPRHRMTRILISTFYVDLFWALRVHWSFVF